MPLARASERSGEMPIENRELTVGTVLVARHKGKEHRCEVVQTDAGLRYRLADGKEFNSPSSAGRAITDGVAVNGWRFWSLDGELKPARTKTAKKAATKKAQTKKATKKASKKAAKKKGGKTKAQRAASRDSYGCGVCNAEFPTLKAATKHATEAHIR
jgi:hypothetical protein